MPVRVLDAHGSGVSSNVAAGIIWAADHGARVINLSLGGGPSPGMQIAMQYALTKNTVVLAAAGNNGAEQQRGRVSRPRTRKRSRSARSTRTSRGRRSRTRARYVDVSAPGNNILSTWSSSSNSYAVASGTSMATPYASAEAALIIARNPKLSAGAVTSILESTARDAGPAGVDSSVRARPDRPRRGRARGDAEGRRATAQRVTGIGSSVPSGGVRGFGSAQVYGGVAPAESVTGRARRAPQPARATGSSRRRARSSPSATRASTAA